MISRIKNLLFAVSSMGLLFAPIMLPATLAQDESIRLTTPLVPREKKEGADDKKKAANHAKADKNTEQEKRPIKFGLTSQEVLEKLGRPIGKLNFGGKLTLFYERGEIEFVDNRVDRFKWDGKLYTYRKMPELARRVPGALVVRSGGQAAPQLVELHEDEEGITEVPAKAGGDSGTGQITTSGGREAKSSYGKTVFKTKDRINAIQAGREQQIRDAGLEEILLSK